MTRWLLLPLLWAALLGCASQRVSQSLAPIGPATAPRSADLQPPSDRAAIRLALARAYVEQGRFDLAEQELAQALAVDPQVPGAANLSGLLALQGNQLARAEQAFEAALGQATEAAQAQHNLAWLRCVQGRYDDADGRFERLLATPQLPQEAASWRARGVCQARAARWSEAERSLLTASALEPQHPLTQFNLAQVMLQNDRTAAALQQLAALNRGPQANAESLLLGIRVAKRLGHPTDALAWARDLEQRFAGSVQWRVYQTEALND